MNKNNLASIIKRKTLPKVFGAITFFSLIVIVVTFFYLQHHLAIHHKKNTQAFTSLLQVSVSRIHQQVISLAANSLMQNNAIKNESKAQYLDLVYSAVMPGKNNALVVSDHSGKVILGKNGQLLEGVNKFTLWKRAALFEAKPYINFDAQGVLIAEPLLNAKSGNSTEATIIAYIDDFSHLAPVVNTNELILWLTKDNRVLYSSDEALVASGSDYDLAAGDFWYTFVLDDFTDSFGGDAFANDLGRVISLTPLWQAYQPLIVLVMMVFLTLLSVYFLSIFSVRLSSKLTINALQEFQHAIVNAALSHKFETTAKWQQEPAEFESLRENYNQLLTNLSRTTISLEMFEGVMNSLSELIFVVDHQHNNIMNNHSFEAFCKRADYDLPQDLHELIPEQYLRQDFPGVTFEKKYRRFLDITEPFSENNIYIRWNRADYCDSDGKHMGYVFVGADISQAKSLEDELLLKNKAIDEAQVAMVITDAKQKNFPITYVNKAFTRITGYESHEVLGKNCRFLQGERTEREDIDAISNALEHNKALTLTLVNYKKDGSSFYNELILNPIFNEEGAVSHYLGLQSDVTERETTTKYLNEAKKKAEESAALKSEFLASMSHEIRTPMNGVLGMLGLLMRTNLDQEQAHQAKLAKSSADSLLVIINDILDFSKIEAGKLDLENIPFDLLSQIGELAESVAPVAQEKGLELLLDLSAIHTPMVSGDPGRIRQILSNLLSNAIKFTQKGEITIRAQLLPEGEKHCRLHCSVTDSGSGIKPHRLAAIFDSFTQADASTTREFGGTGLGLSITQQLCKLMHGFITVTSELGKGSQFTFDVLLEAVAQTPLTRPNVDLANRDILIVDDNAIGREVLRSQLELWGGNITDVQTAEKALQSMALKHFDIVFIDMHMPNINGAQLGERIRANEKYKSIGLILMTTINQRGDANYFSKIGFNAYFPKPATIEDLHSALDIVIDGGDTLKQAKPLVTRHYIREINEQQHSKKLRNHVNINMLLVEDNRTNRFLATSLLKSFGGKVTVAVNGMEALTLLKAQPKAEAFEIIFMDCQMPEMDGYEATQRIRLGEVGAAYKTVPIIAMTANAMKGDKEKCMAAGMDDYVSKPINVDVLMSKVFEWSPG